jgi:DNA-binding beta-propeller fold protein YncE
VDVFDPTGQLKRSFGTSGRAPGQFDAPTGVASDASGMRAVTDIVNGRVQLVAPDGTIAAVWGSPNPGPTILPDPVAVAFDAAGTAFVLDQRRGRIQVFERTTGQPSRTIGTLGSGPGQLLAPTALAIDGTGEIAVADAGNERLVRFAADGSYLGATPLPDTPRGIAVTPDGLRTYVSDAANRITVYDADDRRVTQFGGTGTTLGKLNAPAQIALDPAGNLWVADRGNNRVQEFGPSGERLLTLGARGVGEGELLHPTSVAVDCNGHLTVADNDNNRVLTFQLTTLPAALCVPLPPPGSPPALQYPTLPAPVGPVLSVRVLRTTGVLATRNLPVRVGCDTTCTLTATATITPRATPRKGRRAVAVKLTATQSIPAGTSQVLRLAISRKDVARLRRALAGRRGLMATVGLQATAAVGQPTSQSVRVDVTA